MRRASAVLLLAAFVGLPAYGEVVTAAEDQPEAEATAPDLFRLLADATEDQRVRALRFLENGYPDLSADLYALLQAHHPGIFTWVDAELRTIIAADYPRLGITVEKELHRAIEERYPQVRQEIVDLIEEKYPELLERLREGGAEGDTATETAALIREKHRSLLDDVLALLKERHPGLLQYVQQQVIAQHPGLLADLAAVLVERYPEMTTEVTAALAEKHPELLPGLIEILTTPPAPPVDVVDEEPPE